jgi:hypothetical protein
MTDRNGLYAKYLVSRIDGKSIKGESAIVLELGDPLAWTALQVYANCIEVHGNKKFADDMRLALRAAHNEGE